MDNIFLDILNETPSCKEENDYILNGITYCGKCNKEKTSARDFYGRVSYMPIMCDCRQAELEAFEKSNKKKAFEERLRAKGGGLTAVAYKEYTFANDDGKSPTASRIAMLYVDQFAEMKNNNTGLLIGGPVGTGKTFIAGCIVNALLDKQVTVCMTSFPQVINNLQVKENRNEYIDNLVSFELLVLDDLGVERTTEYGLEQLFNLVDARYKRKLPLIVTTNLTTREMANSNTMALRRIYDRINEMCPVGVLVDGVSRRSKIAYEKAEKAKIILGL